MASSVKKLRDYQLESLEAIDETLQAEPFFLLQAITGAGKTLIISRLINRYWFTTSRRFLILVNKQELVNQFYETIKEDTDIPDYGVGVLCAGVGRKETDRLTIATVQTMANRIDDYEGCDLLVLDEAHGCGWCDGSQYDLTVKALMAKTPNMRILGCTSTPFRLGHGMIYGDKCKPGGKNLFPRLNHRITYDRLKSAGHLVELRGKIAHADQLTADLSAVQINGDYVLNQLGDVMTREIHLNTARDAIREFCVGFKKICVFCCTIEHAERLRDIISVDEPCTTVHSQLSQIERYSNLEAWKTGRVRIMTSVNILAEGVDLPALDCLVFARPTVSPRLYLQAVGRVLRTHPDKEFGFLLDLTDNTIRFGTDLDNVNVDIPRAAISEFEKKNPLWKLCPQCSAECHKALRICGECGFVFPVPEVIEADSVPEMGDVVFDKRPPIMVDIIRMESVIHDSVNGKRLGRVKLFYEDGGAYREGMVSVWFCFSDYYSGYAIAKGMERWEQMSDEPYPESCEDFEMLKWEIVMPKQMILDVSGKYPEIEKLILENDEDPVAAEIISDEDVPF
jgi:DNA repair protein RadD